VKITNAIFVKSSSTHTQCPEAKIPEYAFIGRSNVGKSSLINTLLNNKNLAKISGKPGKTQLINHFIINDKWYIADLPGFGYAKVSKRKREEFHKMIKNYLINRKNLMCVLFLLDSRQEPQDIDQKQMIWLTENYIPFIMIFTKADKLSKNILNKKIEKYKNIMLQKWSELPDIHITSSKSKQGVKELIKFIEELNPKFYTN
tara:strand:- start:4665 stop:5270 length:606 start_codon:yes stop_codon:yes gene_type:complete